MSGTGTNTGLPWIQGYALFFHSIPPSTKLTDMEVCAKITTFDVLANVGWVSNIPLTMGHVT